MVGRGRCLERTWRGYTRERGERFLWLYNCIIHTCTCGDITGSQKLGSKKEPTNINIPTLLNCIAIGLKQLHAI